VAFKRVVNIIRQARDSNTLEEGCGVEKRLFEHESEIRLFSAYREVRQKVTDDLDRGSFYQALLDIASLKGSVDAFFDGVLVMAEDSGIRQNRLALLGRIAALFETFADFSKIST
jgi:glycyl-tRNA synthetase beta chain